MVISGERWQLVRSVSPTETAVLIIGEDALLTLVADYVDRPSELLCDGLLVASLAE